MKTACGPITARIQRVTFYQKICYSRYHYASPSWLHYQSHQKQQAKSSPLPFPLYKFQQFAYCNKMERRGGPKKQEVDDVWGGMSLSDVLSSAPQRSGGGVARGSGFQQSSAFTGSGMRAQQQQPVPQYSSSARGGAASSSQRGGSSIGSSSRGSALPQRGGVSHSRGGSFQRPQEPQPVQHQSFGNYGDEEFEQADFEEQLLRRAAHGGSLNPRPDPSKKQVCHENMPVKLNPTGKYNLNFIDWDNEWERVFEYSNLDYNPASQGAPIEGMEIEVFEQLYDQYMADQKI